MKQIQIIEEDLSKIKKYLKSNPSIYSSSVSLISKRLNIPKNRIMKVIVSTSKFKKCKYDDAIILRNPKWGKIAVKSDYTG